MLLTWVALLLKICTSDISGHFEAMLSIAEEFLERLLITTEMPVLGTVTNINQMVLFSFQSTLSKFIL